MREIFVTYLSTFLNQWAGASESASILFSSLFPLMGIPGCLSAGMLVDKYQRKRNGAIMVSFTGILTVLYVCLAVTVLYMCLAVTVLYVCLGPFLPFLKCRCYYCSYLTVYTGCCVTSVAMK